jgi:DNA-directed RNA polymerase specialized sigma24 family protein
MPYLNNGPGTTPEEMYPTILQRLSNSLRTQTIPKANEWIHYNIKEQNFKSDKNIPFFPSTESREVQQIEHRIEKAVNNQIEQQQLVSQLLTSFSKMEPEEKYFLQHFYIDQKSFAELADAKKYTIDKVRLKLRQAKLKLASLMMTQTDGK